MAPELMPMEGDVDSPPKPTMEADVYAFAMVALEVSHIPSVRVLLWEPPKRDGYVHACYLCWHLVILSSNLLLYQFRLDPDRQTALLHPTPRPNGSDACPERQTA
jgi:hypothetical protein